MGATRLRPPRWLVGGVVALLAGVGLLAVLDEDSSKEPAEEVVPPRLESLDVQVVDFQAAWNAVIDARGAGDRLAAPAWEPDPAIGLESWSGDLGGWGTVDLYRRIDADRLAGIDLFGAYATAEDQARFRVDAVAAVAAALALDAGAAEAFLVDELGIDTPAAPGEQAAERAGVRVTVIRDASTAQLRIAVPNAPG